MPCERQLEGFRLGETRQDTNSVVGSPTLSFPHLENPYVSRLSTFRRNYCSGAFNRAGCLLFDEASSDPTRLGDRPWLSSASPRSNRWSPWVANYRDQGTLWGDEMMKAPTTLEAYGAFKKEAGPFGSPHVNHLLFSFKTTLKGSLRSIALPPLFNSRFRPHDFSQEKGGLNTIELVSSIRNGGDHESN